MILLYILNQIALVAFSHPPVIPEITLLLYKVTYLHWCHNKMIRFLVFILLSVPAFAWLAAGRVTARVKSLRMSDDEPAICIGHGFDIHRLIEGTPLVIGGVTIPYSKGADAHSDGDAMYHSIVDSILGPLLTHSVISILFTYS